MKLRVSKGFNLFENARRTLPAGSGQLGAFERAMEVYKFPLGPDPIVFRRPADTTSRFPIRVRQPGDGFGVKLFS